MSSFAKCNKVATIVSDFDTDIRAARAMVDKERGQIKKIVSSKLE